MSQPSVAIIGGGITGLTAAFRLRQQGVDVTVCETASRVGGVIQSVRRDGYLAEFGPNTILETSPKIRALIHDLKLDAARLYSDPRAANRYLVRGGRPIAMPTTPGAFLGTPLFSLGAKLRLFLEPFVKRAPADLEESVAEFVLRRIGREFLEYAINPLVSGVYAGDPYRISVTHAFPKLREVEQRWGSLILGQILGARERKRRAEVSKQNAPKLSFRGGLQDLVAALEHELGGVVQTRCEAQRLSRTRSGRWELKCNAAGAERLTQHDAVLLAIPAYRLAKLELAAEPPVSLSLCSEIRYPPVASVVLGYRREEVSHPLDGFGMLIPQIEGFKILGTIFSSSLFPERAPEGCVTLTSYVGGTRAPELAQLDHGALVDLTHHDLTRILGIRGRPTFAHCMTYPRAIPQYEVGYGRFREFFTAAERQAPGLFFAGHYRDGVSLGDSICSGAEVAQRMAAWLTPTSQLQPTGARPQTDPARP